MDEFPYQLVPRRETVGPHTFDLLALDDFERTTAAVYAHVRGRGTARWRDDLCPMFGVIWSAARAVADQLAREDLRGLRVLELGCGLALPSLVAARGGADVIATDQHPHAEALLLRNLDRNGLGGVRYRWLDWREPAPDVPDRSFDRVVASDVLFAPELPPLVAGAFSRFLAPDGVGWLGDPGRPWLDGFVDACGDVGLEAEVDVAEVVRPDRRDEVFLLRVLRS